jgi:hypothetical protein
MCICQSEWELDGGRGSVIVFESVYESERARETACMYVCERLYV